MNAIPDRSILGNIDYGAVYLLRRRLKGKIGKNVVPRKRYEKIETKVIDACRM